MKSASFMASLAIACAYGSEGIGHSEGGGGATSSRGQLRTSRWVWGWSKSLTTSTSAFGCGDCPRRNTLKVEYLDARSTTA
jgi:hypothetical protein